jgi:hypothetical protein
MPNSKKREKQELTLDDLARMVQEGFAQTASKQEDRAAERADLKHLSRLARETAPPIRVQLSL